MDNYLVNKENLGISYDLKRWGLGLSIDFNNPETIEITLGCIEIVVWVR